MRDIYPESALLESSDFHGNENSLSFIALRPLASIGINNGECTATFPDETREVTPLTEDYNVPEAMKLSSAGARLAYRCHAPGKVLPLQNRAIALRAPAGRCVSQRVTTLMGLNLVCTP